LAAYQRLRLSKLKLYLGDINKKFIFHHMILNAFSD
jgi:hypothetical protein